MLEQYHFLKCEEQFFSSNIINSPYRGLIKFQECFKEYRIVVFGGLNCEDMFDGQVESEKELTCFMMV